MSEPSMRDALRKSEVFSKLSDDEVAKIEPLCQLTSFEPGHLVIEEDQKGGRCFVIVKGRVDIEIRNPFGEDTTKIATIRAPDMLGELSLVDGFLRSANARASDKVTVIAVDDTRLRALMEQDASIGYKLMREISKILATRIRDTNLKLRNALADIIRIY